MAALKGAACAGSPAPNAAFGSLRSVMTGRTVRRHTITALVDNEPGVLARVIGLFSGRGYNIESLTVAEVDKTRPCRASTSSPPAPRP